MDANYYSIIVILFLQYLGLELAVTRIMKLAAKKGKTDLDRDVTEKYKDEYKNSQRFVRIDAYNAHYCPRRRDVVQFGRYVRTYAASCCSFRA